MSGFLSIIKYSVPQLLKHPQAEFSVLKKLQSVSLSVRAVRRTSRGVMGAMQYIAFSVSKYGIHFFAISANFEFGDKNFELGRFLGELGKVGISQKPHFLREGLKTDDTTRCNNQLKGFTGINVQSLFFFRE